MKHTTNGKIKGDSVESADVISDYAGVFKIPCSRARIGVEGKPYERDPFECPDGDKADQN